MRYANAEGARIEAAPGLSATCPTCAAPMRPKCGAIVVWHWAHIQSEDCDPWAEPDSAWHRGWQDRFPKDWTEVTVGPHRADVMHPALRFGIEFQHSSISVAEIAEREAFYGPKMAWVFDVQDAYADERIDLRRKAGKDHRYRTFRWKHPRKSIAACRNPVFLDLDGTHLLRLGKLYPKRPCGGFGSLVRVERFLDLLLADAA